MLSKIKIDIYEEIHRPVMIPLLPACKMVARRISASTSSMKSLTYGSHLMAQIVIHIYKAE